MQTVTLKTISGKKIDYMETKQETQYESSDSLAAEAHSRTGKILVWKEGVHGHLVIRQLPTETLA